MRRLVVVCLGAVLAFSFALPASAAKSPPKPRNPLDLLTGGAWGRAEDADLWNRTALWDYVADAEYATLLAQQAVPVARGGGGGSCPSSNGASDAPPGFPPSIIQRESGGDPNAVNRSSGACGPAQILPSWFQGRCSGMSYAQCWALLWNGGAGGSNWSSTGG